jgi:hypothetical protein
LKTNLVRPKKAHLTEVSKCHGSFRRHDWIWFALRIYTHCPGSFRRHDWTSINFCQFVPKESPPDWILKCHRSLRRLDWTWIALHIFTHRPVKERQPILVTFRICSRSRA